ncbi:hypothetical protein ACFPN0_09145 [Kitasatospora cinereorecta]
MELLETGEPLACSSARCPYAPSTAPRRPCPDLADRIIRVLLQGLAPKRYATGETPAAARA